MPVQTASTRFFSRPQRLEMHGWYMRQFIAIDVAFSKTAFDHVLGAAGRRDAENELVILGWALMPQESGDTWTWFMEQLQEALPGLNQPGTVIISDRQKVRYSGAFLLLVTLT